MQRRSRVEEVTSLKKYNLKGEELGSVEVSKDLATARSHSQSVKDYIIALRANARQWSASTKTRAEVKHTTKKPSPQKGQGRARHGNLVAPQYRGGGRAFGPRPKFDMHVRINRKERKAAVRALIAEKIREGHIIVVDSFEMEEPRTKVMRAFFQERGCDRRVLVIGEGAFVEIGGERKRCLSVCSLGHENIKKSVSNLPGTEFRLVGEVDGQSVALAKDIVISQEALSELEGWLVKSLKGE